MVRRRGRGDVPAQVVSDFDSSNVDSFWYFPGSRTLHVKFQSGSTYRYDNVPPAVYDGLRAAESKGKYHYHRIRTQFPYQRIS